MTVIDNIITNLLERRIASLQPCTAIGHMTPWMGRHLGKQGRQHGSRQCQKIAVTDVIATDLQNSTLGYCGDGTDGDLVALRIGRRGLREMVTDIKRPTPCLIMGKLLKNSQQRKGSKRPQTCSSYYQPNTLPQSPRNDHAPRLPRHRLLHRLRPSPRQHRARQQRHLRRHCTET